MTSSPIRGRQAVAAHLSFGDAPQSQPEDKEKEGKFQGALNAVAQREEHRRRRGKPAAEEDAPPADAPPGTAARPGSPPAARARVLATSPQSLDARRQALLARVPAGQKKPAPATAVPRAIAEAVTDPRMVRPSLADLEAVQTDPLAHAPPVPLDPFADMETLGGEPLGAEPLALDAPAPPADAAPVNQGDGTSLPVLDEDDFFEIDVVEDADPSPPPRRR